MQSAVLGDDGSLLSVDVGDTGGGDGVVVGDGAAATLEIEL